MRACEDCRLPLTAAADDGTGRHRDGCPRRPDREAYLADKARRMPDLAEHHERLRRGDSLVDILRDRAARLKTTELPPGTVTNPTQESP